MNKQVKKRLAILLVFLVAMGTVLYPSNAYAASSSYKYISDESTKAGKYYYKVNDLGDLYRSSTRRSGYKRIRFPDSSRGGYCANGKYIYTVRYYRENDRYILVRYDNAGKNGRLIKKLPLGKGKEHDEWCVSQVAGNNIMLSRINTSLEKCYTYKYNLKSKKLSKVLNNCEIVDRSGNYVLGNNEWDAWNDPVKVSIYKISSSGKLRKIKSLGTIPPEGAGFAGKKLYYSKDATGPYVDLYRSNRDGSDAKKIESFYYDPENEMLFLMNFRSKSCDVYDSSGIHKYTYKS